MDNYSWNLDFVISLMERCKMAVEWPESPDKLSYEVPDPLYISTSSLFHPVLPSLCHLARAAWHCSCSVHSFLVVKSSAWGKKRKTLKIRKVVKVCMEVSRNDGPQKSQIEDGCEWMVLWGIQIWIETLPSCDANRTMNKGSYFVVHGLPHKNNGKMPISQAGCWWC